MREKLLICNYLKIKRSFIDDGKVVILILEACYRKEIYKNKTK